MQVTRGLDSEIAECGQQVASECEILEINTRSATVRGEEID